MAIEYEKIGWDTSKYINPTDMNHMDDGIKAACDGVDELGEKVGATDISKIGDGSITGAVAQNAKNIEALNSNLGNKVSASSKTLYTDVTLSAYERKIVQLTWEKPSNSMLIGLWINTSNSLIDAILRNTASNAANIILKNTSTSSQDVTVQLIINYISIE